MPHLPRRVLKGLGLLLLILALAAASLLALALQREPTVSTESAPPGLDAARMARVRAVWQQVDPRGRRSGQIGHLRLQSEDLNALLAQAGASLGLRSELSLDSEQARLRLSLPLRRWPLQPWLNLDLSWQAPPLLSQQDSEWPRLRAARLGRLPLPPAWVEAAARWQAERQLGPQWVELAATIERWQFGPQALWLRWRWRPELAALVLRVLWTPAEREALRVQHRAWRELAEPGRGPLPLIQALGPLAKLALQRVQTQGADPALELRALLLQLALHSLERDLGRLLPEAQGRVRRRPLLIAGRVDMAQHFLLSAWLSWQGGAQMTRLLGLAKEVLDTDAGGSGFSFNDLAADAAGERFGRACAANPVALLAALATGLREPAFFPQVDDLPEFLSAAELRQRYGGVDSPAWRAEMARIRARVDALPIYQGIPGV